MMFEDVYHTIASRSEGQYKAKGSKFIAIAVPVKTEAEVKERLQEVRKAYHKMAIKYHPDKVSHLGEDVKIAAEQKFTKLNAAYVAVKQERGMN